MRAGFRFHPKAVLLSGLKKATLLVGSGNLTFGGWRENAEIWVRLDTDIDGTGSFMAFKQYLGQILSRVLINDSVRAEVDEAFDENTRDWAADLEEPSGLIGKIGAGDALIDYISRTIGKGQVKSVVVCTPYFDSDGEALRTVKKKIRPKQTKVLVQKGRSGLNKTTAAKLSKDFKIQAVGFHRMAADGHEREIFIHAKFFGIEKGRSVTVFAGSANCSRAALTIPGSDGNAELMTVQTLTRKEFQKQYLDEFMLLKGDPELPDQETQTEKQLQDQGAIRILAARLNAGNLMLGYSCTAGISITRCMVNEVPTEVKKLGSGIASAHVDKAPRTVILEGLLGKEVVRSNASWVDNEFHLRSTSRSRSLAEAIKGQVQPGQWNMGAWTEVLEVFFKHLQYMPSRSKYSGSHRSSSESGEEEKNLEYTAADVFSSSYDLPTPTSARMPEDNETQIRSLQQLFLRWFGVTSYDEKEDEKEPGIPGQQGGDVEPSGEAVDMPESIPTKSRTRKPVEVTDRERHRAQELIQHVAETMSSQEFLEHREPELLATDLKITAILLRTGLWEGWINHPDFFECTHKIWSSLFFTSDANPTVGWLEYRYRSAKSPGDFVNSMKSGELTAALVAWSLAIPIRVKTPDHVRFVLSCVLSVARLPWLWDCGDLNRLSTELDQLLTQTAKNKEKDWENVKAHWLKMMRRGSALQQFERVMAGREPKELSRLIKQDEVVTGELLWQGSSGLCVAVDSFKKSRDQFAMVYKLQGGSNVAKFQTRLVIPLRALLDENIIPKTKDFGSEPRTEIANLIKDLKRVRFNCMKD
jgi:hypothetical protein